MASATKLVKTHGADQSIAGPELPRFAVRHYTVPEIASLWSLSDDAVRKIFEKEPGVSILLGHQSVRITEKHYAPWVRSRQEQLEADLESAWKQDPLILLETKGTL